MQTLYISVLKKLFCYLALDLSCLCHLNQHGLNHLCLFRFCKSNCVHCCQYHTEYNSINSIMKAIRKMCYNTTTYDNCQISPQKVF